MEALIVKQDLSQDLRQAPRLKSPKPQKRRGLFGKRPARKSFSGGLSLYNEPRRRPGKGGKGPLKSFREFRERIQEALRLKRLRITRRAKSPASPHRAAPAEQGLRLGKNAGDPAFAKYREILLWSTVICSVLSVFIFIAIALIQAPERGNFSRLSAGFTLPELQSEPDIITLMDVAKPDDPTDDDASAGSPLMPLNLSVSNHVVSKGETLQSVARYYGLRQDSLISINKLGDSTKLKIGSTLKIPSLNGIMHRVRSGDNIQKISKRYKIPVNDILDANNLESFTIHAGEDLFIPGAKLERAAPKASAAKGGIFYWPIRGAISSRFGYRPDPFTGIRRYHPGIDIVAAWGSDIRAPLDGRVAEVGYNGTYGNYAIVVHDNGFQSFYGHMSSVTAKQGDNLKRGDKVGEVGNTGYSTGSHLHFGLYKKGSAVNPLNYLKK
jgi:murein DD-endopeptidase MepM/ murein hydrolase activator NlpD